MTHPGSGNNPAAGGSGMMPMMLAIMQMKQHKEEVDQVAEQNKINGQQAGWQLLTSIAQKTADPMMLTQLAAKGEQWGLGSRSEILDTLGKVQPDESTLRSFGAVQGMKAATGLPSDLFSVTPQSRRLTGGAAARVFAGAGAGQTASEDYVAQAVDTTPDLGATTKGALGSVMRSRFMTGGGLTEGVSDAAVAATPNFDTVARSAFSMAHGFTPTWEQAGHQAVAEGTLRSDNAYKTGETAIGLTEAATRAAAAKGSGALEPHHLPDLFSTQQRILQDMHTNLSTLSPNDLRQRLESLRGVNAAIRAAGGSAPDFDSEDALKKMHGPGFADMFSAYITSKVSKQP